jgi:hypothetical protein
MRPSTRTLRLVLLALLIIALTAAAYFLLRPRPAVDRAPGALAFCEEVILAELPAPSTAYFYPTSKNNVTADTPEMYRVMMSLDTEDAAGRMVHLNALCRMRWGGEAFDLLGLQMR